MRRFPLLSSIIAAGLVHAIIAPPAAGQTGGYPIISARQYTGGSAKVTVSGPTKIDAEVPINTQASISDGGMTWLQFGASGSDSPNVLITYGNEEVGVSLGKGKFVVTTGIAPGEKPQCAGGTEVTEGSITGHYTCPGVVSYDAASGKMGKVDVDVRFTAKS